MPWLGLSKTGFAASFRSAKHGAGDIPVSNLALTVIGPILQTGVKGLVYALITLSVLQVWSIPAFVWITTDIGKTFSTGIMKVGGIILTTLLIWEVVTLLMESYLDTAAEKTQLSNARQRTLFSVARNALFFVLTTTSTLIILSELGINIIPLLTGPALPESRLASAPKNWCKILLPGFSSCLKTLSRLAMSSAWLTKTASSKH